MPPLPTLSSPSLGTLKYTGTSDARGNPIYKDSKGSLITRQGNQNILSKPANPVASNTSSQPASQGNTFTAVLGDPNQPPIKKFGAAIGDMMLQYQAARTNSIASGDAAMSKFSQEQTSKTLAETPDAEKVFSPGTQSAIRTARANEGVDTANAYADAIRRNDAASKAFLEVKDSIVSQAKDLFGSELNRPSDTMLEHYTSLLQKGSLQLSDIPKEALPFVIESLDPATLPKSISAQTDELKLIDLKNKILGLGPLTQQENLELKQYVQEKYKPEDQKWALDYLTGKRNDPPTPIKTTDAGSDPQAIEDWKQAVLSGNATIAQVPIALRTKVAAAMNTEDAAGANGSYSPLAASRLTLASSRIVQNFKDLPQFQLTANGLPYLQRIDAALKTPGSVSDQDLLDSLTKLNTAGNAISDAQVRLITDGRSLSDAAGVYANKLKNGGVLSNNQRKQIQEIAKGIYANYKKGYQPVYDQVTAQLTAAGIPKQFWTIPDLNKLSEGQTGGADNDPLGIR